MGNNLLLSLHSQIFPTANFYLAIYREKGDKEKRKNVSCLES
jgi:hypothetical protein